MLNKYVLNNEEFLVFGEDIKFPEELGVTLVEENVPVKGNVDLPIYTYTDFLVSLIQPGSKTVDKVLFNNNIKSIRDIMNARTAIMHKCLDLPRSVRDTVLVKYQRLLDYVLLDSERDANRVEEGGMQ
jgi:hypothetical protein